MRTGAGQGGLHLTGEGKAHASRVLDPGVPSPVQPEGKTPRVKEHQPSLSADDGQQPPDACGLWAVPPPLTCGLSSCPSKRSWGLGPQDWNSNGGFVGQ